MKQILLSGRACTVESWAVKIAKITLWPAGREVYNYKEGRAERFVFDEIWENNSLKQYVSLKNIVMHFIASYLEILMI
jgi:hypothetical protein